MLDAIDANGEITGRLVGRRTDGLVGRRTVGLVGGRAGGRAHACADGWLPRTLPKKEESKRETDVRRCCCPAASAVGKKMSLLPLDPSLSRALLASKELGCLDEMMTVVSELMSELIDRPHGRLAGRMRACCRGGRRLNWVHEQLGHGRPHERFIVCSTSLWCGPVSKLQTAVTAAASVPLKGVGFIVNVSLLTAGCHAIRGIALCWREGP